MKTAMHDNDLAHISRNENFKLLTLLAKGMMMMRCLSNNQCNSKMIKSWSSDHECQYERDFFEGKTSESGKYWIRNTC